MQLVVLIALTLPLLSSTLTLFVPPSVICKVYNEDDYEHRGFWTDWWSLVGPATSPNGPQWKLAAKDEPYTFQANVKDHAIKIHTEDQDNPGNTIKYNFVLSRGRGVREYLETTPGMGCEAVTDFGPSDVENVFAYIKIE